jgi:hypothetical protein
MIERRAAAIANEIRLLRQQHKGAFLIVEGRDDRLFAEKFARRPECRITVAEGKDNVMEVIRILDNDGFKGALGMVDADHDRLRGKDATGENVIVPETHSLEALLIASGALDAVLVEFGSQPKIEALARHVRDLINDVAAVIGCLRLHSTRENLLLRFDGINYLSFIDINTLAVDITALLQEVKNRTRRDLDANALANAIATVSAEALAPCELCCGDDLVAALAVGLRRLIGSHAGGAVGPEEIKRALRLAFSDDKFRQTSLYQSIRKWEAKSAPFRIISDY